MGNEKFDRIVAKMPILLRLLESQSPIGIDNIRITQVPQKGVYIFFEGNKPIYVGRSNRLKERLKEHSQRSSDRYSATLAFRIAKQNTSALRTKERKQTNAQLMENRDFVEEFEAAKDRIARARIRFIEIEDQIEQAMFEIYASLTLDTELNVFLPISSREAMKC